MKKYVRFMLCTMLGICLLVGAAWAAAESQDSEASLRWLLSYETGQEEFAHFYYGDYDGDGSFEAFALVGEESNRTEEPYGMLWFVSAREVIEIDSEDRYYANMEIGGNTDPMLFFAEESFTSSVTTRLWTVLDSTPQEVSSEIYGNMTYAGGNEFLAYIDAYDMYSDGTGHTWKCYYYFLDGMTMREYGGIYITQNQLLALDGAEEILMNVQNKGWSIDEIIYRGNDIINVNLSKDDDFAISFDNLTLRYENGRVTDTGDRYGGRYALASNPSIAVYPDAFVAAEKASAAGEPVVAPAADGSGSPACAASAETYCFDDLRSIYVRNVESQLQDGLLEVSINFQRDVFWGGSDGYLEHWATESGILSNHMIDLDGDGQEEWLVLQTKYENEFSWESLVIYEVEAGEYRKTAEASLPALLFPLNGENAVRILHTQDGVRVAVSSYNYGDGASLSCLIAIYCYDGAQLSLSAYADMNNYENSVLVSTPLQVRFMDETPQRLGRLESAEAIQLIHDYALNVRDTPNYSILMNPQGEYATSPYVEGFLNCASFLRECGLEMSYHIVQDTYFSYIEDFQLSGGEMFFCVSDFWNSDGDNGITMQLDTDLDHFTNTASAGTPTNESSSEVAFTEEVSDEAQTPSPQSVTADTSDEAQAPSPQSAAAYTSGDVYLRTGPGLGYSKITAIPAGNEVVYLGESSVDERGVTWYRVLWYDTEGWGSSKYIHLTDN